MIENNLQTAKQKMAKSVEALQQELATIRTGHAHPSLVENIKVDYAGVPMPLNQLATIPAPEARLLIIQPWDPTSIQSINKAILKSDLGLNPADDGRIIRLVIPPLSEERRQELVKLVRRRVEEYRVAIRNLRHEAVDKLKKAEKNKEISQDELKRSLDQLQKITDSAMASAEQVGQKKETDLVKV